MQFSELSTHEKAIYTYNQIQKKKDSVAKGKKEAETYSYNNAYKIRKRLKDEKKVSLK